MDKLVVGSVFLGAGLLDAAVALLVVRPLVADPARRRIAVGAIVLTGCVLAAVGAIVLATAGKGR